MTCLHGKTIAVRIIVAPTVHIRSESEFDKEKDKIDTMSHFEEWSE